MQQTVVEAHPEIPANKLIIMSKHTAMTYDLTMRQLFKNELQLEDMAGGYVVEANEHLMYIQGKVRGSAYKMQFFITCQSLEVRQSFVLTDVSLRQNVSQKRTNSLYLSGDIPLQRYFPENSNRYQ